MSYEIRAMSFGEILDAGFRLLRDHALLLVGIAAVVYLPLALVSAFVGVADPLTVSPLTIAVTVVLMVVLVIVAMPIITAGITHALGELYLGRPVTLSDSLQAGLAILLPLMGTWILAGLAVLGGVLLLIVPGIYLALAFMLLTQVMVLENVFGTRALGRSRELMRGHMLRGFGVLFVGAVLISMLQWGIELGIGWIPVLGPLGSGLAQAAGVAYTSAVAVVLYFDIRCRNEAFDLEHLSRLVEDAGATELPRA